VTSISPPPPGQWKRDRAARRFDRSRYDAARTLDVFADRLRDEVELDALRDDLLGAVQQTMAPEYVSVWLRPWERAAPNGPAN
jgi:hypothetical protein